MVVEIAAFEIVIRVLASFAASFIFGLDRQFKKKPVGFGPFTFVTTGATILVIGALMLSDSPVTIFGAIVTGIGFLGAGAIIKGSGNSQKVSGITTAASIWAFAALGITIGLGLYLVAVLFYALIALIIVIDHYFEKHGFGSYSKIVTIVVNDVTKIKEIEKTLPGNHRAFTYNFDNSKKEYTIMFYISGEKQEINMTLNQFLKNPAVNSIKVES
jgi:putative Mg2+ transporter-C (MgtC) family protein